MPDAALVAVISASMYHSTSNPANENFRQRSCELHQGRTSRFFRMELQRCGRSRRMICNTRVGGGNYRSQQEADVVKERRGRHARGAACIRDGLRQLRRVGAVPCDGLHQPRQRLRAREQRGRGRRCKSNQGVRHSCDIIREVPALSGVGTDSLAFDELQRALTR